MMTLDSPHSPGVIGILREAVDIPCRSWKLMVSITLLALVPMTLLSLTTDLTLTPLIMDMTSKMAPMTQMAHMPRRSSTRSTKKAHLSSTWTQST